MSKLAKIASIPDQNHGPHRDDAASARTPGERDLVNLSAIMTVKIIRKTV